MQFNIVSAEFAGVCDVFGISATFALNRLNDNLRLGLDGKLLSVSEGFTYAGTKAKIAFHSGPSGDGEITIAVMEGDHIIPSSARHIHAKIVRVSA